MAPVAEPNKRADPDELEFALSDATTPGTRAPGATPGAARAAPPAPWQRLPFQPRQTTHARTRRAAGLVAIVLLALALLLTGSPGLRSSALALVMRWLPAPLRPLGPGDDLFYLVPEVPWGTVLLDGRPLATLPLAGSSRPLRLARGRHIFEWRAAPFMPLRCQVSVPDDGANTCWQSGQPSRLFLTRAPDGGSIIPAHDDLNALPVAQRAALLMTTQIALAQSGSQTVLQPGEPYAFLPALGSADRTNTATQPLRATLSLHLLSSLGAREPCAIGDPRIQPCRFIAQDCSAYCTLPAAPAPGAADAASPIWFASTFIWVSWDYATLAGAPIALNQGDPGVNFRLLDLAVTWDGTAWHVAPLFGHQPNQPTLDDTVCSAARVWLARGPLAPLLPDGDPTASLTYHSGASPAAGCAVVVTPHAAADSLTTTPSALFLARCGILVAANATAHALWPALPQADAPEAAIARQLAAQ